MLKNNKKITVFLDLDGTTVAMIKAACLKLGIKYPSNYQFPDDKWLYSESEKIGLNKEQFWSIIRGVEFWENLEIYNWTKKLIQIIEQNTDNWAFLSKCSKDPECWSGKYKWFVKNFGEKKLWLVSGNKELAASETKILIDDKKENCEKWSNAGGWSYLWPEITDNFDPTEVEKRLTEIENLIKYVKWYNSQN